MRKFWCCYVNGTGGFRYQHPTLEDARGEAERLARMPTNRGCKVFVLEAQDFCSVPETPVFWDTFEPYDEIPF